MIISMVDMIDAMHFFVFGGQKNGSIQAFHLLLQARLVSFSWCPKAF